MSLVLILGCMFSGKSKALMSKINEWKAIGKKCIIINHTFDTRCGEEIRTHEGTTCNATKLATLDEFEEWKKYDVIGIDEAQFFPDIVSFVKRFIEHDIQVVCAGLSGDYQRKPFETICGLISLASDIIHKKALCVHCANGNPAIFSKRLVSVEQRVLTGGVDTYEPVCLVHFSSK